MANGTETTRLLESFLMARIPFISIRSQEQARVREMLTGIARGRQLQVLVHGLIQGLRDLNTGAEVTDDRSLFGALEIAGQQFQARQNFTVVFTDVQHLGDDNEMSRRFADLAALAEERGGSIVVLTPDPIWPRLQRLGMSVTLDPPDLDEMRHEVTTFLDNYRSVIPIEWGEPEYEQAASILCGVTKIEALNILATLVVRGRIRREDMVELSRAKDSIFSDLSGIERVVPKPGDDQVGGLAGLQAWLRKKRPLLTMDLRDRGMRPPRGVLLVGVPGCGKSLSAKAVAASWQLPLYRLDMASIFGQYVGQSENRLKDALATADTVSPCVLWIDEIEKGLAGSGSDSTGVTTRLVGQFLYWLQESDARVFVVATANDVRTLPQELLRSGRFDEMFFVDLPDADERREIIRLYLRKYLRAGVPAEVVEQLVELGDGFAGSDLESAVKEIGQEALRVGDERVPIGFMIETFRNVVPLSVAAPERIAEIRSFGDRALPASGRSPAASTHGERRPRRVVLS